MLSERGNRINRRSVEHIINLAYKIAGLESYNYTTHTLRHTYATCLYEETKDILIVKELLGHKRVTTTEIYTHISSESLKNAVNSNPLNNCTYLKSGKETINNAN